MNNEIKVSLNITLPGRVVLSKDECLKTTQKEIIKKNNKTGKSYKKIITEVVEDLSKMDKSTIKVSENGRNNEVLTIYTRKCKPATQSINLYKDTYDYMTSKECPEWCKVSVQNQMGKKAKLEAHLKKIAEHLGGKLESYQIFED